MSKLYLLVALSILCLSFQTVCQDSTACPDHETCCQTPYGTGCCPYENATCCPDGLHCCPSGYTCGEGYCTRSTSDGFMDFVAEKEKLADIVVAKAELEGIPNIKDLIKCVGDIKPFAADLVAAVKAWKNGDKSAVIALLPKILQEGVVLGTDCSKVIKEIIN